MKTSEKKVEIYHPFEADSRIETLFFEGLKSEKQLSFKGKLGSQNIGEPFKDYSEIICFQWIPPYLEDDKRTGSWVSVEVNPKAIYVFNGGLRDADEYSRSKMTLENYIYQHTRAEAIRPHLEPGNMLVFDPFTAEPEVIDINDTRAYESKWQYDNEIPIREHIIPPKKLKFTLNGFEL